MSDTRVLYKPYIVGGASTSFVVPAAVVGPTFPDAVAGLVGGGASYTGWWGMRAYSQAKATAQANAIQLRSINTPAVQNIRLTAAGVLNAADIALLDNSTGLTVSVIYDQVGSANWPGTGGANFEPLFHQDYYGANKHAIEFRTGNTSYDNITNFPNSTLSMLWTSHVKRPSGMGAQTVIWGANTTNYFVTAMDDTNVSMSQSNSFLANDVPISELNVPLALLWHFNGTGTSAINKGGSDTTFTGLGTNGIVDNVANLGFFTGGTNGWIGGFWSEGGFMTNTVVSANSIDATKRSAITTEMANFY